MKNLKYIRTTFIQTGVVAAIVFGISSCNKMAKTEDTKVVAEESNEMKFGNGEKERDAEFLVKAAEVNLEEIELGKLAQENSENANVQELGKMMEEAHKKCLKGLTALAEKKMITIPLSCTDEVKAEHKKLSQLKNADFDKEFCGMMVKGHEKTIAAFEKETKESKDKEITLWAENTLPDLKKHLELVIVCQKKVEKV
jgi:putative membrane protein